MKNYNLNILGTKWRLKEVSRDSDPMFGTVDGFTDRSSKTMYVANESIVEPGAFMNWPEYMKSVKRHEIIHAFMLESGLAQETYHPPYGADEQAVDFFAIQFPKMLEVFKKAEAI